MEDEINQCTCGCKLSTLNVKVCSSVCLYNKHVQSLYIFIIGHCEKTLHHLHTN